ncbi:DNA alkylation repair protein [Arthrobacter sp. STN4]|uniref:DNA alkylation repair protein n=1 Tax=Arthrobacter sp. STN4 TaxID=2923276 RepID=UPI00211A84CF|nr:DNA alkylation repair protein [Arthrobacter sp. STN4]MCQ9165316.1 DNA alkylation repair protein [Arthrobacter sp. STN4]
MTYGAVAPNPDFLAALRPALGKAAEPERAAGMAAYMKSAMPYLGVRTPEVRRIVRALVKEHPLAGAGQLYATAARMWGAAEFREERHAAIMLTDSRLVRGDPGMLPFYATAIAEGQWWDHVDSVAPRLCGLLLAHPESMDPLLRRWSGHGNFWFRRAAIIAQLPAKAATDTGLLHDVLVPNLPEREFFIRKAVGWALRQHARTDPAWVLDFAERYAGQLSPLSRREALKHLG